MYWYMRQFISQFTVATHCQFDIYNVVSLKLCAYVVKMFNIIQTTKRRRYNIYIFKVFTELFIGQIYTQFLLKGILKIA